jgi:hypothetical protein
MPFSLSSYLLGVGTVVGALAFGVGSGTIATRTAVKETTAAGPARAERVARAEPTPAAPQVTEPKENPAPSVEPAPAVHPDPLPSAQAETPTADIRNENETAAKRPEPAKQHGPANQREQRQAAQKAPERRIERQKHYAERRARPTTDTRIPTDTRMKQRQWQDEREPSGFAFGREEPRFELFGTPGPRPFHRWDED